jgi:hypothetical protein
MVQPSSPSFEALRLQQHERERSREHGVVGDNVAKYNAISREIGVRGVPPCLSAPPDGRASCRCNCVVGSGFGLHVSWTRFSVPPHCPTSYLQCISCLGQRQCRFMFWKTIRDLEATSMQ